MRDTSVVAFVIHNSRFQGLCTRTLVVPSERHVPLTHEFCAHIRDWCETPETVRLAPKNHQPTVTVTELPQLQYAQSIHD